MIIHIVLQRNLKTFITVSLSIYLVNLLSNCPTQFVGDRELKNLSLFLSLSILALCHTHNSHRVDTHTQLTRQVDTHTASRVTLEQIKLKCFTKQIYPYQKNQKNKKLTIIDPTGKFQTQFSGFMKTIVLGGTIIQIWK